MTDMVQHALGAIPFALPRHSDPMEWLTLGPSPNKRCLSSHYASARLKEAAGHASSYSDAAVCPVGAIGLLVCTWPLRHPATMDHYVQHVVNR